MAGNFWGDTIRSLRMEQGISQRMLASKARVNRATLRRVEAGTADGHISFMEKVLGFLGYELEAIMVEKDRGRRSVLEAQANSNPALSMHRILNMDFY